MKKEYVSWDHLGQLIDIVIRRATYSFPQNHFTRVVGIARGGIIPASTIANCLERPLDIIYYSSKVGRGGGKYNNVVRPYGSDERLLVVDDLTDTGNTIKELKMLLPDTTTFAVLMHKQTCPINPDIFGVQIPKEQCDDWIVFPYEKDTI